MSTDVRTLLLSIHRWVGLTAGFALLLLAVTGGLLVLRGHLEDGVNARLVEVPACRNPLSIDHLAAIAQGVRPHEAIREFEVSVRNDRSVAFQYPGKDYVFLDPCDGKILGIQNEYGGAFGTLDSWHRFRFMPEGREVAGTFSLITCVALVIFGIVIWWPRSRSAIRTALTYNRKLPGIARTLSLHRVFGIYASALLFLMMVTAIPFSFEWGKSLIEVATGSAPDAPEPPEFAGMPGHPLPLQQAWDVTRRQMPSIHSASFRLPSAAGETIRAEAVEAGAPHEEAKSYIFLDPANAKPLKIAHYDTGVSTGRKVWAYSLALHSGLVGGIAYQVALLLACFAVPVMAYSGMWPWLRRKIRPAAAPGLKLKLVARHAETPLITAFEFADPAGKPLPAFSAGSHIDVRLPSGIRRQYSLCNDPLETHRYQVAVLREAQSRGGSREMHDALKVGDVIEASFPRNHFQLVHGAAHSVLIAGGIGITPLLCMAERLANSGSSFELHYCAQDEESAAFRDRLASSPFAGRVHFHYSKSGSRLDLAALMAGQTLEAHIYTCGPPRLIDAVIEAARQAGLPAGNVHREYFEAAQQNASDNRPFDIRIASTGEIVHVPKDQTITSVLEDHGIDVPMSCSQGLCGTCITRVIEGEIDHRDVIFSQEERDRNDQMTLCCSRASGEILVLDL
jgi:vanillate O-demethylase ferredoxin subunit